MTDPKTIRVLSVDDHPLLREGIATLINSQADMRLIAEAANGQEAMHQFDLHQPDVTARLPSHHRLLRGT